MSVDMERRIFAQRLVFDWITKVVINYKKLPKANVNYVTTKKQLDTLNAQWEKAQTLHCTIDYKATEEDRKTGKKATEEDRCLTSYKITMEKPRMPSTRRRIFL